MEVLNLSESEMQVLHLYLCCFYLKLIFGQKYLKLDNIQIIV